MTFKIIIPYSPLYAGNASLVKSILALHLRIGLGLVLEKEFEFGLNSSLTEK